MHGAARIVTLALWATAAPLAAQAVETRYHVDSAATRVDFSVRYFGFGALAGTFANATGTLRYDETAPDAASFTVSVPAGSASTGAASTDAVLRGPDWLDAAHAPLITVRSLAITRAPGGEATARCALTLRNMTAPAAFTIRRLPGTMNFDATGQFRRSQFGMTSRRFIVGDVIRLTIHAVFVADAP